MGKAVIKIYKVVLLHKPRVNGLTIYPPVLNFL